MECKKEQLQNILNELLPKKSKEIYNKWYDNFINWQTKNELFEITENTLLLYFDELSKNFSANSLWTIYSCLKKKILLEKNIDIKNFAKITNFLKIKNNDYLPKKAAVFKREEIENFLDNASNQEFIREKLIVLISLSGGMRCDELINLCFEDIKKNNDGLKVTIKHSKTDQAGNGFEFFVLAHQKESRNCLYYLNFYENLVEKKEGRLFRQIRNKKHTLQPCGRSFFLAIPKKIAQYLKLENFSNYTGHSFRRTAATWMANSGAADLELKKWGRWKSEKIAGGYVDQSDPMKRKFASIILGDNNNDLNNKGLIEKNIKNNKILKIANEHNLTIDNNENPINNIIKKINVKGGVVNINIHQNKN